jgi:two-component system response regulator AtoC
MQAVRQRLYKVVNTDVPLLIEGDNGTGKEVVARLAHASSIWKTGAFVKVNCAAIPGALLESELFGYEKGAFTGANVSKPGRVETADGGTLFLDGIDELDLALQAKMLQFLQDGQFCRIGDNRETRVKTRIICATNQQLEKEVERGRFRLDLYYRINVFQFKLPHLNERRADIPGLISYFISAFNEQYGRNLPSLSWEVMQRLQRRDWPGNIRELENCIARCVILGAEDALAGYFQEKQGRPLSPEPAKDSAVPFRRIADQARRALERDIILKTLETYNWNRRKTAEALKISYRTLLYKVREAGLPVRERKRNVETGIQ